MELNLENRLTNSIELKQNEFLQSTIGKAINNGINIGLRYILPDWVENKIIELKDNLLNYGLKDGIRKTIESAINTGKSATGILTGNFENINQINEAVKSGGIIDSVSDLMSTVLRTLKNNGKIDNTTYNIIQGSKDAILNNVEKNIEITWNNQIASSRRMEKYLENWKTYYSQRDFQGMEKEYQKIKTELKELVPIENTINNARTIETLHQIIKNNGQNFYLSDEQRELAEKLSI